MGNLELQTQIEYHLNIEVITTHTNKVLPEKLSEYEDSLMQHIPGVVSYSISNKYQIRLQIGRLFSPGLIHEKVTEILRYQVFAD